MVCESGKLFVLWSRSSASFHGHGDEVVLSSWDEVVNGAAAGHAAKKRAGVGQGRAAEFTCSEHPAGAGGLRSGSEKLLPVPASCAPVLPLTVGGSSVQGSMVLLKVLPILVLMIARWKVQRCKEIECCPDVPSLVFLGFCVFVLNFICLLAAADVFYVAMFSLNVL